MPPITKQDIAEKIAKQLDLSSEEADHLVNHFFEEILLALENGESVLLSDFGYFSWRDGLPVLTRSKPTKTNGNGAAQEQVVEVEPD